MGFPVCGRFRRICAKIPAGLMQRAHAPCLGSSPWAVGKAGCFQCGLAKVPAQLRFGAFQQLLNPALVRISTDLIA
jgi:hypothetical protein